MLYAIGIIVAVVVLLCGAGAVADKLPDWVVDFFLRLGTPHYKRKLRRKRKWR